MWVDGQMNDDRMLVEVWLTVEMMGGVGVGRGREWWWVVVVELVSHLQSNKESIEFKWYRFSMVLVEGWCSAAYFDDAVFGTTSIGPESFSYIPRPQTILPTLSQLYCLLCYTYQRVIIMVKIIYITLYTLYQKKNKHVDRAILLTSANIFSTVSRPHEIIFVLGLLFHHTPPYLTLGTLHGCDASLTLRGGTHSGGQSPKVDGLAPPHYVYTHHKPHTASSQTHAAETDAAPRTANRPQQLQESWRRTQRLLLCGVSRVLCHRSTSGGKKGVVRRRTVAAHTSLLARGLTPAPITMTHPPGSSRLVHRNLFLAKKFLHLRTDTHSPPSWPRQ